LNDRSQAANHFAKVTELAPSFAEGWRFYAIALFDLGEYPEAYEAIQQYQVLMEDQQQPPQQIDWVVLGWLAYGAGDTTKAREYTLTALKYNPMEPYALYNLALLQTEDNDLAAATATYTKALQADADQVLLERIIQVLKYNAITRKPSIASFHYALGLLLEARAARVEPPERGKLLAEARAAYEAYLANAQDPGWRAKARKRIKVLRAAPMVGASPTLP
jgi:tetratricopeptide (TPR) repeat protein